MASNTDHLRPNAAASSAAGGPDRRSDDAPVVVRKTENPWRGVARSLIKHPAFIGGGVIFLAFLVMATFAPLLAPHDPSQLGVGPGLTPPGRAHLMGTDDFGRDIWSRVVFGSRISLAVGFLAVAISVTIGTLVGLVAGYNQRKLDSLLMRLMDVLLAFPGLMLALAVAAVMGTGLVSVIIAVGVAGIPNFARIVRSAVMGESEKEYILAARTTGCSTRRILRAHIFPNVTAPVIVMATLYLAFAVLAAASLSFLGVGVQPPTPEWGAMTSAGRHILVVGWWVSTFPGLMIVLFVLSVNVMGDALRDALDSTLRHV